MMTKSTLKAAWLGGGVVATWLAVTPDGVPPSRAIDVRQPTTAHEPSAEDLNMLAERLRERTQAVAPRPSTRNPFRFNARAVQMPGRATPSVAPDVLPANPVAPPPLPLSLAGIAENKTLQGVRRSAVLTINGEIYLVGEGDSVAGRYTVIAVDPEAVVLRDASGDQVRLILH